VKFVRNFIVTLFMFFLGLSISYKRY